MQQQQQRTQKNAFAPITLPSEERAVWKGKQMGGKQSEEVPYVKLNEAEYNNEREEELNNFEHHEGELDNTEPPKRGPEHTGNEAII